MDSESREEIIETKASTERNSTASNTDDGINKGEVDTLCGYTSTCKPLCLQKCAKPSVFLTLITITGIVQGTLVYQYRFPCLTICINNIILNFPFHIISKTLSRIYTAKDLRAEFYLVHTGLFPGLLYFGRSA